MYLLLLVVCCLHATFACSNFGGKQSPDTVETSEDGLPLVLWWYDELYSGIYDNQDSHEFGCPSGASCIATKDRSVLSSNRDMAIMIYGTDFKISEAPFPRKPNHAWALLHEESPQNNYVIQHQEAISQFNYTATFQRTSHYPLTTQALPSIEYLTEREPIPVDEKNRMRKAGMAPVFYLQSNCDVPSDRDRYVKELMKYIQVDSYGTCLNNIQFSDKKLANTVTEMNSKELLKIAANYKFHLAFENAICNDYITEKFFRPLHVGSIPVYHGSPSAREWAPNDHSIIMVSDYASPERLAVFLEYLDTHDDAYVNYLSYRETGIDNKMLLDEMKNRDYGKTKNMDHFVSGFECFVCDQLTSIRNDKKNGKYFNYNGFRRRRN